MAWIWTGCALISMRACARSRPSGWKSGSRRSPRTCLRARRSGGSGTRITTGSCTASRSRSGISSRPVYRSRARRRRSTPVRRGVSDPDHHAPSVHQLLSRGLRPADHPVARQAGCLPGSVLHGGEGPGWCGRVHRRLAGQHRTVAGGRAFRDLFREQREQAGRGAAARKWEEVYQLIRHRHPVPVRGQMENGQC